MANPLSPMAQPASRGNDASMSMLGAVHQMKSVGQASYPKALRRVRGRAGISGFSLVELMVAVAIIGILMAIALPVQKQYLIRANKSAAKSVILEAVSRQEQYIVQNRAYFVTTTDNDFSGLGMTIPSEATQSYSFTITAPASTSTNAALAGMPTFQVTATPRTGSVQEGQSTLYMNQFGLKMPVAEW